MGHQLSKFPLSTEQIVKYGVSPPQKLVRVVFRGCGHPASVFENAVQKMDLSGVCWACQKYRK